MGAPEVGARLRARLVPDRTDPTQVVLRRIAAKVVEALLIAVILAVVVLVAGDVRRSSHGCPKPIPNGHSCLGFNDQAFIVNNRVFLWFFGSLVLLMVLVFAVIPRIAGASPGKLLMRIRVVRPDGARAGWRRGLVRALCWGLDGPTLILPIGLWFAWITPRHRRIGDYLAGTYVVRREAAEHAVPRRSPGALTAHPVDAASPVLGV